ncbi:MAG: hypothetical protein IJT36_00430 [Alphaproteobacteria bacterium]|nr:hypothetical protein [Alphaproteobacteria bacterium]
MFFKKKKEKTEKMVAPTENTAKAVKTIKDVETAIDKERDPNKLALLCTAAGMAYMYGEHNASVDINKAENYLKKGMEYGSQESYDLLGELYISSFTDDIKKFSKGIVMMCHRYSEGNERAGKILQFVIDENVLPGYTSVEQLVLEYEASI